jgi:hypothetical protein
MIGQPPTLWLAIGFLAGLALTVAVGRGFTHYMLETPATPYGIIDLELAGSADGACRTLTVWRCAGLLARAWPNLWLDMLWIVCYTAMMVFGCLLAARAFSGGLATVGLVVAGGQVLAGALDYGENVALLRTLRDFERGAEHLSDVPPRVAAWCSRMKLRLLTLGLVYMVLGGAIALFA